MSLLFFPNNYWEAITEQSLIGAVDAAVND
jgi:hypothetical protein